MRFVLDASTVGAWLLPDESDPRANAILGSLARDAAIAPLHWWFEVRNVLATAERRARTSPEQTSLFLERLSRLPIALAPLPDHANVMHLARQHRLTFYDAAYVELAKRELVQLATLDGKLAAAARSEGIALVAAH
ncbi:MAG TPA: type II toxin-antitoxin system VapC family toxin [Xanthobacteraceae bacterium]|nr:type II toxin-antitoxin system VapC family toxin [Xanthobacteraceae bacterium]